MIKTCIIGASGYTGSELARLVQQHPELSLDALYVSENSADAHKPISVLYPALSGVVELPLVPLKEAQLPALADQYQLIYLATPHETSHRWMPQLAGKNAVVMDLSGAYRFQDVNVYAEKYGFEHNYSDLLSQCVYGLADWHQDAIVEADVIAVPGCYPTASLTALKPLQQAGLIASGHYPVINAVSGVSGAGRKAALNTSFCEVSLQAYGVLSHRHQPEIATYLDNPVIFTPHLGNFKRGILATITVKLADETQPLDIEQAYAKAYSDNALIRIKDQSPKIDDVAGSPYCDLFWQYDGDSHYLVVVSAIDNLLKGASAQAIQCANLRFGFAPTAGLIGGAHE